ncbi:hypothetical protein Scep_007283 [Stephania cephalantha]|uniref:ATP-dependent DNA helicase n=1 Tax=Stephania cephalantha TaxID=152367 RepID=A0AAP0PPW0_9MAGN
MIALATASSSVAASLLPGGRTAHSRFKLPINLDGIRTCNVSKQSMLAKLLLKTHLVIWDEAPMSNKQHIEALDSMLRDVTDKDIPFGGKVIVFCGDFRQVLPVVPKGNRQDVMKSTLTTSYIWPLLEKIKLVENMRARLDPKFSKFILRVGNGTEDELPGNMISIPSNITLPYVDEQNSLEKLITAVYPNLNKYTAEIDAMSSRAILTTKNEFVDEVNSLLIQRFPGEVVRYYNFDEILNENTSLVNLEFLNSLSLSGFPPHDLMLKKDCPVILLRNINPSEGLCNGTRLICRRFEKNIIDAEIATGHYKGKRVFLPRIPFIPNEEDKMPFKFKRRQFPIRLCFAMTINKAQGQTLNCC